jgi:Mg-chelatase subunit ChlD
MSSALDADDAAWAELVSASAWDVATRYHEFKSKPSFKNLARHLRRISADAVLLRAQNVLGSIVHPVENRTALLSEIPQDASQLDLDLDETLELSPLTVASSSGLLKQDFPLTEEDLWMSFQVPRRQSLVLAVDTSLSMTGEKLALTAVALAVVLLQFPEDPVAIVAFENMARVIKGPEERISLTELIERFLDVPAQGYTHLEEGMRAALRLVQQGQALSRGRPPSTVLLTDGKYTAGRDPAYLAPRFPHLTVLKMGHERASWDLCRELAHRGHGSVREVDDLQVLPSVMYGLVKDLLCGRRGPGGLNFG